MPMSNKASKTSISAEIMSRLDALIGAIIPFPGSLFFALCGKDMPISIAILIWLVLTIVTYIILIWILNTLRKVKPPNRQQLILGILISLAIILAFFSFHLQSNIDNLIAIQDQLFNELSESYITQTSQDNVISNLQATINFQSTIIASSMTPIPHFISIEDLPPCDFDKNNFPCKYWTDDGDYSSRISIRAYGNAEYSGRIAELYRDEKGSIPPFMSDQLIIIPDNSKPQNESYYEYYFSLLSNPIPRCVDRPFSFPCWLVSEGESYSILAGYYPAPTDPKCIQAANKTEWNVASGSLDPINPLPGIIFVLPTCP